MSIKSKIRTIPNFPIKGIKFRDISTLIGDPEGLNIVINRFRERYKNKDGFDFIAGIEARGFIVGSALAYALNKGFIMIRKPDKLPGKVVAEEYQLEYGSSKMEMHEDAFSPDSNILLVDDLLATGGTMKAAIALIEKTGGFIFEVAVIVDLPDIGGSKKLTDEGYKIFSLTEFTGN